MRRRTFNALAGGGTLSMLAPPRAGAQQPALPVIGFLSGASPAPFAHLLAAFRDGLGDTCFIEGRNVVIETRWAEGRFDRLPALADELVRRQVAVIVATGGDLSARAAKAASTTIPIVFSVGADPVAQGLVASLNRPGGNVTGLVLFTTLLEGKRLGLLHEAIPSAGSVALLVFPGSPNTQSDLRDAAQGAHRLGVQLVVLEARTESEIDAAFVRLVQKRANALVVGNSPFFNSRREQIVVLAARHKVPAIYEFREFAAAGGLMSYGASLAEVYRQIGVYTGRILKGAKPAELPVIQPTRFELVINLNTAKALGLTIPQSLLLRSDEVVE